MSVQGYQPAHFRLPARAKLAGPSTMREKRWTHLFIVGKSPDEAANEANVYYTNSRFQMKR
jgi:hypothetical protein